MNTEIKNTKVVNESELKELNDLFELAEIAIKERLLSVPEPEVLGKLILEHLNKLAVKYNFDIKKCTVDPRNGNIVNIRNYRD